MGVIVELQIPAHQFEFGQRFPVRTGDPTQLERVASMGDDSVPLFSLSGPIDDQIGEEAATPSIAEDGCRIERLEVLADRELCVVKWNPDVDLFFRLLGEYGGAVRYGTGTMESWTFGVQFPGQKDFSAFRSACNDSELSINVTRVYNPTSHDTGAWYGLTPRQRRTLELAVERGYYDIPRRCTTIELADELGISDQAVTERLRRGIVTFVTNTLLQRRDD